jgi:hypothetical protein
MLISIAHLFRVVGEVEEIQELYLNRFETFKSFITDEFLTEFVMIPPFFKSTLNDIFRNYLPPLHYKTLKIV